MSISSNNNPCPYDDRWNQDIIQNISATQIDDAPPQIQENQHSMSISASNPNSHQHVTDVSAPITSIAKKAPRPPLQAEKMRLLSDVKKNTYCVARADSRTAARIKKILLELPSQVKANNGDSFLSSYSNHFLRANEVFVRFSHEFLPGGHHTFQIDFSQLCYTEALKPQHIHVETSSKRVFTIEYQNDGGIHRFYLSKKIFGKFLKDLRDRCKVLISTSDMMVRYLKGEILINPELNRMGGGKKRRLSEKSEGNDNAKRAKKAASLNGVEVSNPDLHHPLVENSHQEQEKSHDAVGLDKYWEDFWYNSALYKELSQMLQEEDEDPLSSPPEKTT